MNKPISLLISCLAFGVAHGALADVPLKPWGKPSLQGNWDFRTITPFQRPAAFADQEFLSPQEVEEYEAAVLAAREARATAEFDGEYDHLDGTYSLCLCMYRRRVDLK